MTSAITHRCHKPGAGVFEWCDHTECAPTKGSPTVASPIRAVPAAAPAVAEEPKDVVRVFLRGGGHFDIVGADEVSVVRSSASNEISKLEWTTPESGRPLYVRLAAVDAVVDITGAIE